MELDRRNFLELRESGGTCIFIDGGNAELIASTSFSVHLIRVYNCVYKDNKRIRNRLDEFYCVVFSEKKEDNIVFRTRIIPIDMSFELDESRLCFNSTDRTLSRSNTSVNISSVAGVVRRFAELQAAMQAVGKFGARDMIVIDGALNATITNEADHIDELYEKAKSRQVAVCGVAKTSRLFADNGMPAQVVMHMLSGDIRTPWLYRTDSLDPKHHIMFAKFHPQSKYIFRLDKLNTAVPTLGMLVNNSTDPIFLGYPYGLIEADKFARVSNTDKEYYKIRLLQRLPEEIESFLTTIDAHGILDTIG